MNNYQKWYNKNKEHAKKYKREMMRKLRAKYPERYRMQTRAAKARLKMKVFDVYGAKCAWCGFSDIRALTLDHVNNDGAKDRKENGERGVYLKSLKPENRHLYQTLCMNCQFIKRHLPNGDWHNSWLQQHGEFLEENK
jgi:hypothetical protein